MALKQGGRFVALGSSDLFMSNIASSHHPERSQRSSQSGNVCKIQTKSPSKNQGLFVILGVATDVAARADAL